MLVRIKQQPNQDDVPAKRAAAQRLRKTSHIYDAGLRQDTVRPVSAAHRPTACRGQHAITRAARGGAGGHSWTDGDHGAAPLPTVTTIHRFLQTNAPLTHIRGAQLHDMPHPPG